MRSKLLAFVLGTIFALGIVKVRADLEVSADVRVHAVAEFHAPLAAHGAWIEVGGYGRCWRPAGIAVEWRPYCEGHWIWTDCGWYWVSDEPWAWACYHYGWWTLDSAYGWIWVPGIEWAPAWVTWRVGGGYCGWAPLPPRGVVVRPAVFVFVEERRFHEPVRSKTVIVNNTTIINKTTIINNERRETRNIAGTRQKVVINEGPNLAAVQKASGQKLAQTPVQEAARQTPKPQAFLRTAPKSEAIPPRDPAAKPNAPDAKQDSAPGRVPSTPVEKQTSPQLKDLPKQRELPPENERVVPGRPPSQTVPPRKPGKPANAPAVERGQEKGHDK